ncbi:MAG: DmsC/YnfH family molybdoenzyme membrane anchor subunit [Burkholderiaceae bacterium]
MRPAPSVILLTTLIGVGQGLFLALFSAQTYALVGLLPRTDSRVFYAQGSAVALAFLSAGLIASFFHLGRPERAWRTATQWRSSWLSREVIALPAFMLAVVLYGAAHALSWNPVIATLPQGLAIDAAVALGLAGSVLAFALFVCTAMIYACLPFLAEWHTPLTLVNYTLLGAASGFTLAAALAASLAAGLSSPVAPHLVPFFAGWAIVLTVFAALGRIAALRRNARLAPKSTSQSAIGVKHPTVVQKSQGFMGGSFNTREFFHGRGAQALRNVKWAFLLLTFVLPLPGLALGLALDPYRGAALWLALAFAVQYLGLLAERWFFFAQANHPQNLYYQAVA